VRSVPEDGTKDDDPMGDPLVASPDFSSTLPFKPPLLLLTGCQLFCRRSLGGLGGLRHGPLSSGLGRSVDETLLAGGIRSGELLEVFGAAGVGKTQLALTIAQHLATCGNRVTYATSKDTSLDLTCRLADIFLERNGHTEEGLEKTLNNIDFAEVSDFSGLSRLLQDLQNGHDHEEEEPPGAVAVPVTEATTTGTAVGNDHTSAGSTATRPKLLVVDMVSALLAPFASSSSTYQRWRLCWCWMTLRKLAQQANFSVLMLSHTVGSYAANAIPGQQTSGPPQALATAWQPAAAVRLELHRESGPDGANSTASMLDRRLRLTLRMSRRKAVGSSISVAIDAAGAYAVEKAPPPSWGPVPIMV